MDDDSAKPGGAWSPLVIVLMIANVAMFGLEIAKGVDAIKPTAQGLIDLGGNYAPLTLHGEPWRLVICMFMHAGLLHLGMNMLCLYQGRIVEKLYGRAGFLAIYVVAGLIGGIASVLRSPNVVSVGASGAVFGVFGAFGAFVWIRRAQLDPDALRKTVRGLGIFVGFNFLYGMITPGVDMTAHVGGIVGGFACGCALLVGEKAREQRVVRAIAVAVVGIGLVVGAMFVIPERGASYMNALRTFDAVQPTVIEKYNALVVKRGANELTDEQFATAIDTEILPPWKAMHDQIDAASGIPERLDDAFRAMRHFVAIRESSWRSFAAALRDPQNEALQRRADQEAGEAAKAVSDLDQIFKSMPSDDR